MAFDQEAREGIITEAKRLGVEWEALAAVAEVESGGRPLWDGLCPIRIEGHYFYRRLSGTKLDQARLAGLAHPKAGKVTNPKNMKARYKKLDRMKKINANAALESCSWGLGQVMGAHWKVLDYQNVKELVEVATESVSGQIQVMGRFIQVFGLTDELKRRDWAAFAKGYNGKNYKKYKYHKKMAKAYQKFSQGLSFTPVQDNLLRRGDRGEKVRLLIERLTQLRYYEGPMDDIFGGGTEQAVMTFQSHANIQVDGVVGPETAERLKSWSIEKREAAEFSGVATVVYINQHAIRNRACTPNLEVKLASAIAAVYGPNHTGQIFSGGQPRLGSPGNRTGSIRHDDYGLGGRALDARIVNGSGKRLQGIELAKLGQYWLAKGHGGCGLEMNYGGIHLDEWTTPPPGGGMYWTYSYNNGKPWAKTVRQMLVDGNNGQLPELHNG